MDDKPTPISRARNLRQNMTGEERLLWLNLRDRKFMGLKFLRQRPFVYQVINNEPRFFVADFYCDEKKLIIEVDGTIHDFQKEEDQYREEILKSLDLNVLRIKNEEFADVLSVLDKIRKTVYELDDIQRTHPRPTCSALPPLFFGREGGDVCLQTSG